MTVQEMDAAARMQRTASLFIQMVNTAVATDDAPIVFVPMETSATAHAQLGELIQEPLQG
jgi:hypothetical protein